MKTEFSKDGVAASVPAKVQENGNVHFAKQDGYFVNCDTVAHFEPDDYEKKKLETDTCIEPGLQGFYWD